MSADVNIKPCPCPSVVELKEEIKFQQNRIHKGDTTFAVLGVQMEQIAADVKEIKEVVKMAPTQADYDALRAENEALKVELQKHIESHTSNLLEKVRFVISSAAEIIIIVVAALILYNMKIG